MARSESISAARESDANTATAVVAMAAAGHTMEDDEEDDDDDDDADEAGAITAEDAAVARLGA